MRDVRREGECLVFTGPRNKQGYGRVYLGANRQGLAHRIVWRHHNPNAAEPEAVMHACDNPPCVEPSHLLDGTRHANSADMVAKGRSPQMRGERSGRAKLTDLDVALMRAVRELGYTTVEIGRVYGIDSSYVSRLVRGERRP
jgi:hypothetical protein